MEIDEFTIDGYYFNANHSFLYAIIDHRGTILWIGRYTGKGRNNPRKLRAGVKEGKLWKLVIDDPMDDD